jgi:phosphoribosylformylglycinamidine cyclo-ligase
VGVVEKARMLDGRSIRPRDVVLGLAASGLHTNGYSLARRVLFDQMKLKPATRVPELGMTVGEELLKVHRSYGPLVQALLKKFNRSGQPPVVKGLAHLTGGGFIDNIPRILPKRCDARIRRGAWPVLPIFELIQRQGGISDHEMHQVFNMGVGMTLIVAPDQANAVLRAARSRGHSAWPIGEVVSGQGRVRLE